MVSAIYLENSNVVPISNLQKIEADVQEALSLIDEVKKQDNKKTVKQIQELLIEYILANMRGDTAGATTIQNQLSKIIETYGKDVQNINDLKSKVEAMVNPSSTVDASEDLAFLQGLIGALRGDVTSGDMSNLTQYESQSHPS